MDRQISFPYRNQLYFTVKRVIRIFATIGIYIYIYVCVCVCVCVSECVSIYTYIKFVL